MASLSLCIDFVLLNTVSCQEHTTPFMTNLVQIATQPPSGSLAADGQQWIHGFIEVVKILAVLVGSLAGGYFSHRLLLCRDASGRKRAFRAFVVQFRSEADGHHPPNTFGQFYKDKVPYLRHAVATVEDDFSGERRVEFKRLIDVAAGFTGAEVENRNDGKGKRDLLAALDAIIQFVDI